MDKQYILNNSIKIGQGTMRTVYELNNRIFKIGNIGNSKEWNNYNKLTNQEKQLVTKILNFNNDILEVEKVIPLDKYLIQKGVNKYLIRSVADRGTLFTLLQRFESYFKNIILPDKKLLHNIMDKLSLTYDEFLYSLNWGITNDNKLVCLDFER